MVANVDDKSFDGDDRNIQSIGTEFTNVALLRQIAEVDIKIDAVREDIERMKEGLDLDEEMKSGGDVQPEQVKEAFKVRFAKWFVQKPKVHKKSGQVQHLSEEEIDRIEDEIDLQEKALRDLLSERDRLSGMLSNEKSVGEDGEADPFIGPRLVETQQLVQESALEVMEKEDGVETQEKKQSTKKPNVKTQEELQMEKYQESKESLEEKILDFYEFYNEPELAEWLEKLESDLELREGKEKDPDMPGVFTLLDEYMHDYDEFDDFPADDWYRFIKRLSHPKYGDVKVTVGRGGGNKYVLELSKVQVPGRDHPCSVKISYPDLIVLDEKMNMVVEINELEKEGGSQLVWTSLDLFDVNKLLQDLKQERRKVA